LIPIQDQFVELVFRACSTSASGLQRRGKVGDYLPTLWKPFGQGVGCPSHIAVAMALVACI
jgi:hypothetical protein